MADATSSSSLPRWSYDVFLSFRGEDTRRSFVDHLYSALCRVGVNTFRDSEELRKGEDISVELLKAIEQSKVSIIVFSETYVSSRWCLEELVKILECKERLKQVVLPVFYHVHPSEVRKQTGGFGDALTQHRQRFTNEKVNEWKAALTEVANFSGWDLQNVADGYESKLIDKIIGKVLLEVNCTYMNVAKHPVGIDIRAKELLSVLQLGTNDEVRMIGIYGMGGIGKTTLAKSVYNQTFQMFEGSCFLANVRSEASEKHAGLTHLQQKLLCKTLKKKKFQVDNVDEGISLIKARLGSKRVLVVLDDVDHISQLESLAGQRDWFGSSSRVIITTRDAHLLSDLRTDEKYEMQRLSSNESLQLFSWHAFGCFPPAKGYNVLSKGIVNYAAGLPLALVVLGSHFRGRSKQEWIYDFEKLRQIPHGDVQKILRISYDSLDDDTQNIFLDIACFFIGSDIQDVVPILNGCGFYAESGMKTLVDRSLLTVCKDGELQMHDLVRDMGREVVRMDSPRDVGKRSRLFLPDDVSQVLQENKGTEAIEGMIIHSQMLKNVQFSTKLFSRMVKLRILKIDGDLHLKGSFKYLSSDLRLFSWRNCQLRHIPSSFRLQKLVCLDLQGSNIEEFQPRLQHFSCLKILKLDGCGKLKTTPDFTRAQTLQRLSLTYCSNLVEMPESIGDLKSLVELDLSFCSKLRELPNSICQLKALEKLSMWSCSDIQLPTDLGKLERLRELDVNVNAFSHLSFSCGDLCSLKILRVNNDHGHKVGLPPICFGGLSSVEYVYIISSYCHVLPFNLFHLSNLISLTLVHCTNLRVVQEFPPSLKELFMYGCISLELLPDLSNLKRLNILDLHGCESLVQLQGLEFLESLQEVDIRNCSALISFPLTDEFFKAHSKGDIIEIFFTLNEFLEWNISLLQGVGCSSSTGLRMPLLFEHEFIGMIFGFFDQGAQSVIINNRTTNAELLEYWAMGGGWKVEDGDIWLLYIPKHHFRGSIEFGDKLEVVADTPEKGSDEEQDVFLDTPERNLACECKIQLGIYQDKDGHLFFFRMNRNVEMDDISEYTTSPRSYNYPPSFSNEGSDLDIDYDSIGEIDTNSCVYDSIAEIDTYSCSSYTGDYNISSTPGVSRFDGSSATCSFSNATTGELFDSPGVVGFGGNLSVSSSSNATPVVFCSGDSFVASSSSITTPSAFSFGASLSSNATPSVFSGSCIASSCSKAIASVFSFSGNSIASSPSSATPSVTSFNANYVTSSSSNGNPNVFSFGGRSTASFLEQQCSSQCI
ncbi:TMV resistance protein N-like [Ipomoea triloba]|uniref:TMV resistance protein N-like n=1 Tax=Ipomoea triloba TaxID=35885 RepID=UPI00125E519F|nr:TMV resistance protein N-like [Ipomoea triloba]XP_031095994.1 TMV resistance protein N-like [Ipomoea triloba]XP_031095995.1 TMV resistance protein N-like [Ipomoea triloba]XP_031095997.1 TMV resistance protein N-like [Ipomoea triloba]